MARSGTAIAAERNVKVVHKPGRQGNVPSAPEIPNRFREVGMSKVLHQPETETSRCTACDQRISAEVTIDLEGEEKGSQGKTVAVMEEIIVEHCIHIRSYTFCHTELQKIAPQHHSDAFQHLIRGKRMHNFELRQQIICPFYRSCHQLRKERNKQRIGKKITFRRNGPAIYIHQISDRLKREE